MSLTDTERHWLWGCAAATAARRSDENVAMPHLRGRWSPTNAILRTLECSFMRYSVAAMRPLLSLSIRFFRSRRSAEMQRVPQILQLAVVVDRNRPPVFELQHPQKSDFLFGGVPA